MGFFFFFFLSVCLYELQNVQHPFPSDSDHKLGGAGNSLADICSTLCAFTALSPTEISSGALLVTEGNAYE